MKLGDLIIKLSGTSNFPQPIAYVGPKTRSQSKAEKCSTFSIVHEHMAISFSYFKKIFWLEPHPKLITRTPKMVKIDRNSLEVWVGRAAVAISIANFILHAK